MAASPRLDMAFLIERRLFAQQEVLSGERGAWAQAEREVPHTIDQECQQVHANGMRLRIKPLSLVTVVVPL